MKFKTLVAVVVTLALLPFLLIGLAALSVQQLVWSWYNND